MELVNLNARIKFIRKHLQLSQVEFASYLEKDVALIKAIEENAAETPANLLVALLHKLEVSADWLITGEGDFFLSSTSHLMLNDSAPAAISEQYFSLKEEDLYAQIRELEQSIVMEANIPLHNIRALFSRLLGLSFQESAAISFSKLEELSYPDKIRYCKELEKHFKSARTEFLEYFKQLYQEINQRKESSPGKDNTNSYQAKDL